MADNWGSESGVSTPSSHVELSGVEDGEGGLRAHSEGTGFMLRVKPQHGAYKLLPYSRIEEIEINHDCTEALIYAARCTVKIVGSGLIDLADSIQKAKAWSLTVGKAERNNVKISRIDITNVSDSLALAED